MRRWSLVFKKLSRTKSGGDVKKMNEKVNFKFRKLNKMKGDVSQKKYLLRWSLGFKEYK
jgi:hypothetical protein